MAGSKGRRGWGRIRRLPSKSKRYQANYVGPPMTLRGTTRPGRSPAASWPSLAGRRAPPDRTRAVGTAARPVAPGGDTRADLRRVRHAVDRGTQPQGARPPGIPAAAASFITGPLGPVPLHALHAAVVRAWYAGLDTTPTASTRLQAVAGHLRDRRGRRAAVPQPVPAQREEAPAQGKPVILRCPRRSPRRPTHPAR